jgi:hypothetical protein
MSEKQIPKQENTPKNLPQLVRHSVGRLHKGAHFNAPFFIDLRFLSLSPKHIGKSLTGRKAFFNKRN